MKRHRDHCRECVTALALQRYPDLPESRAILKSRNSTALETGAAIGQLSPGRKCPDFIGKPGYLELGLGGG